MLHKRPQEIEKISILKCDSTIALLCTDVTSLLVWRWLIEDVRRERMCRMLLRQLGWFAWRLLGWCA